LFSFCTPLDARVLYVDVALPRDCGSGNYSVTLRSCTGSDGMGYSTFSPAIAAMQPGDTVSIRGGVYGDPITVTKSGTAAAHLQIVAYSGESAVIDLGAATGSVNGIDVSFQRYVDVRGLVVRNAPIYGFKGRGSDHITLANGEIAYSVHGGVVFENASNVLVSGCRVHDNNRGGLGSWNEAISMQNVQQFRVTDCDVYDNAKEGIDAKYGSSGGAISRNRSYRNNGPNIYLDGVNAIEVFGNICHDTVSSSKACIGIAIESTYNPTRETSHDLKIYNNVLYGSGAGLWFWIESGGLSWATFSNIRIEYNTIADNNLNNWGGIVILNGGVGNFGIGNTIRNNIFWNNTGRSIQDSAGVVLLLAIDHNLFRSGEPSSSFGSNAVVSSINPFVNQSARDYHLAAGSPARNAGQLIPDITTDLEGLPRLSISPDVGAYQYGSAAPPRTPTNLRIVR
jgi:hypothetical protein